MSSELPNCTYGISEESGKVHRGRIELSSSIALKVHKPQTRLSRLSSQVLIGCKESQPNINSKQRHEIIQIGQD
eukprot:2565674-Amphidinium_carterae.1